MISLYEFAKNYIKINNNGEFSKLDNFHLNKLKLYEKLIENGYQMRLINGRNGSEIIFIKN